MRRVGLCVLELSASRGGEDRVSQSGRIPTVALVGTVQSLV